MDVRHFLSFGIKVPQNNCWKIDKLADPFTFQSQKDQVSLLDNYYILLFNMQKSATLNGQFGRLTFSSFGSGWINIIRAFH